MTPTPSKPKTETVTVKVSDLGPLGVFAFMIAAVVIFGTAIAFLTTFLTIMLVVGIVGALVLLVVLVVSGACDAVGVFRDYLIGTKLERTKRRIRKQQEELARQQGARS